MCVWMTNESFSNKSIWTYSKQQFAYRMAVWMPLKFFHLMMHVYVCTCMCMRVHVFVYVCWQRQCSYYIVSVMYEWCYNIWHVCIFQDCVGGWIFPHKNIEKKYNLLMRVHSIVQFQSHILINFRKNSNCFLHNEWILNVYCFIAFISHTMREWKNSKKAREIPMTNEVDIRFLVLPLHYITSHQYICVYNTCIHIHRHRWWSLSLSSSSLTHSFTLSPFLLLFSSVYLFDFACLLHQFYPSIYKARTYSFITSKAVMCCV